VIFLVIVLESPSTKRSFFDRFRRQKTDPSRYYGEKDVLINQSVSSIENEICVTCIDETGCLLCTSV
jgi:hypothetical protein